MSDDERRRVSSLRALAHPVRLRILSLLTGTDLSAAELARELGISHASASYHLRALAAAGEVVEAGEEKIRGGVAKRYRHPWQHDRPRDDRRTGPGSSEEDFAVYVRTLGDEMARRTAARRPRTRSLLADAEMWVEEEVWERAWALVAEAAALVHAEAKPPRTPGTVHVSLDAVLFQMTDAPETDR